MEQEPLYEKYRPHTLAAVVGQGPAKATVRAVIKRGWGRRAWWITGDSGVGKTSLAKIIAQMGADEFYIEEYGNPAVLMEGAVQRHIESSMRLTAWGKGGRVFIVNEAHGLRKPEIRWLLGLLEDLPRHVVFVFTTTTDGSRLFEDLQGDALPLLSRCIEVNLKNGDPQQRAFARFCKRVAHAEGLDGRPLADYVDLARRCKGNCRAMFQRIEALEMKG